MSQKGGGAHEVHSRVSAMMLVSEGGLPSDAAAGILPCAAAAAAAAALESLKRALHAVEQRSL